MKKTITFLSTRAAMMLLATLLLTAQTAWAADPDLGFITTIPTVDGGQSSNWNPDLETGESYNKLVDGNTSTKYGLTDPNPYVEFHYASAITPKGYALWTANDSNGERNPQSWIIKAKNSGDANWTTLATVDNTNGDKLPMANDTRTIFALNNSKAYTHFRFEATPAANGAFQLAELQFCTVSPTPYIQYATISGVNSRYYYTGSAISITPTVTANGGTPLTLGTHFTATLNGNNVGAFPFTVRDEGSYTLTISGTGNYTGSKTISFTVADCPEGLSIDDSYTKGQDGYYYVNMPQTGSKTLTIPDGFSYKFKVYDNGGKGGSGLLLYGSAPNYPNNCSGTLVLNVPNDYVLRLTGRINTESRDNLTVYNSNQADNSKKLIDAITSTTNGEWYEIPTVASTSNSMTIYFYSDGVSNSDGLDLTVALARPNDLSIATINKQDTYWWNNGTAIDITYTVKAVNGTTLVKGTDYTETIKKGGVVVSGGVKDVGDYTLTITGINNYIGEQTVNFTVAKDICLYGVISGTYPNNTMTLKYGDFNADPACAANNEKRKYTPGSSAWWNVSTNSSSKTIVIDESCQNYQGTSLNSLFNNWKYVTSITGLENLNYHNTVTDMSYMFRQCNALTTLDVSSLNTTTVTNMNHMFNECGSLTIINFGDGTKFNTSKVTDMSWMFWKCSAMTELDLSAFSTPLLNSVNGMFYDCSNLQTIIVSSGWTVASVSGYSTNPMFSGCSALVGELGTAYDGTEADHHRAHIDGGTSNPGYLTAQYTITYNTNGGTMPTNPYVTTFHGKCAAFDLPTPTRDGFVFAGWFEDSELKGEAITSIAANTRGNKTLYAKWSNAVLYAVLSDEDQDGKTRETMTLKCGNPSSEPGSAYSIIKTYNGSEYWTIDFYDQITTAIIDESCKNYIGTSLAYLFNHCEIMTTITGLGYLNYHSTVKEMRYLFNGCSNLTTFDINLLNTAEVTDMSSMFSGCLNLASLDLSSFNTSKVESMNNMFSGTGGDPISGTGLTVLDLRTFNTANVKDMNNMFYHDFKLRTIIVGEGWSTANVTSSTGMFAECIKLVGQNGTAYIDNTSHIDATYACVDAAGTPGYLSLGYTFLDNGNNTALINEMNGIPLANVKLAGRTLYKDGKWNTLCLPFDVTIANSPLAGAEARKLVSANIEGTTLTLNFNDVTTDPVTTLTAGTPYIIKWAADTQNPTIFEPEFKGVAINETPVNVSFGSGDSQVRFIGTYDYIAFNGETFTEDKNILFLGGENKLYYPEKGASIGACRAYFKIGADGAGARRITAFNLNFGDAAVETGIINIEHGTLNIEHSAGAGWYTLDGRRLSDKPAKKGLYINNGKKVVIK